MGYNDRVNIDVFKGLIFSDIIKNEDEELLFITDTKDKYKMFHESDCCESVYIESIAGDLDDLKNTPIITAEEVTEDGDSDWGTYTWTFYKLATIKGYVTIRWNGESNGYYSESVDIEKVV